MRTWQRTLAYAVALVVVFGVALWIGQLVGPVDTDDEAHDTGHDGDSARVHLEPADGHGHDADYELALAEDVVASGRPTVAFRILDGSGEPVTSYDVEHEKQLHLIAVRRDLGAFRHVHPLLDPASGQWTVPIDLGAGSWQLYADFAPTDGEPTVAEAELMVAGDFTPKELGPDRLTSTVDGYEVQLERDPATSTVALHVTRDGTEVADLQPYLGAFGHLVAIRADDLAYLHVHPEDGPPGPEIGFHAEFEEDGRYRLFLDFKHGGRVHTADFTITVGDAGDDDMSDDMSDDMGDEHGDDDGEGHGH